VTGAQMWSAVGPMPTQGAFDTMETEGPNAESKL
jgi:hypothetical protein